MKILDFIQLRSCGSNCQDCAFFDNDPTRIEALYSGLTTMSSGFASVRDRDGICSLHELYLSARDSCQRFTPRAIATAIPIR